MDRDSDMPDANQPPPPSPNRRGRREPSQSRNGRGRRRSPSANHGSHGQKCPRSGESDHNRRQHHGWIFEPQTGVIAHPSDCTHCEAYHHHYMDAALSADATMHEATSQWNQSSLCVQHRVTTHPITPTCTQRPAHEGSIRPRAYPIRPELSLSFTDPRVCPRTAHSAHALVQPDELVARQHELTTAQEQPQDHGASSFPQWGRGQGAYPSNFSSSRPQGSAFTAPSTAREQPALPREVPPTTSKGEGTSEVCSSTSDSTTKGPSSRSKPTKATQWYTAEWSEDEPASDDANNDWSALTQMRSVGDSVILTINKWEFVFSGEAAKNARSAYQKGHLPPVSQGMKHFGNSATPLTMDAINRLFAHAREG
ncbi:hypothetical protein PAXINDRAFT_7834 [Paxillus involutus ATCC 200175]|nr:hypothetical protein PAXINDRAFT_7834 [Paxillus involutus ATCC 200175]